MEKVFTVKHVWKRNDRNQVILENRNDKIKEVEVYASEIQTTVDHVIFKLFDMEEKLMTEEEVHIKKRTYWSEFVLAEIS